ncbi:ATP-binding protein [Nocardioides sp. YIM 152588]|uniref:sensor histidine kinase n=1 Tax=Nocardioides sp. YIM 152588 TaxID=3158259 RepID=UPI0032E52B7A
MSRLRGRWDRLVPRTLTTRLVITAVALVAVVSVLVAGATAVAMRGYLTGRLDAEVVDALNRATGPGPGFPGPRTDIDAIPDVRGQQVGTLTAVVGSCGDIGFVLVDSGEGQASRDFLDDDALALLGDAADSDVREVEVPGHGSYRVRSATLTEGCDAIVGLPLTNVDAAVTSLVRWELTLGLLGVLVAGAAGTVVVRRQLRPLNEVAGTAHAVAELPLASGEIAITERVPERLTDPRTEAGQVGAALNALLDHVEDSLEARHRSEQQVRQFVADASHELRTPLTTIAGYTELARRRDDPETSRTALAKVEEESARMTALVEDLLLLARLDAGRPLLREPVDLTRLAVEAVTDARVLAPDHRWRVELPEDGPVEIVGDQLRLHQVLTNLLTNARKYTPAGTTVTVAVTPQGFEVRDDGPGFPPDLVATAFERFTRGDAARHREGGAGLGLSLVKAIVSAHGGTVELRSEPGDTRIAVTLPRGPRPGTD